MNRIGILLPCFLAMAAACGRPPGSANPASGSDARGPVDFEYEMEGQPQRLAGLRGRPVLLVLMRTSDMPSQIYMAEVTKAFQIAAGKTRFVVLSIEASEAPFLAIYQETEALPFPVGLAAPYVAKGRSELGPIPLIPSTYLIDSVGRVVTGSPGIIRAEELIDAVRQLDLQSDR